MKRKQYAKKNLACVSSPQNCTMFAVMPNLLFCRVGKYNLCQKKTSKEIELKVTVDQFNNQL